MTRKCIAKISDAGILYAGKGWMEENLECSNANVSNVRKNIYLFINYESYNYYVFKSRIFFSAKI